MIKFEVTLSESNEVIIKPIQGRQDCLTHYRAIILLGGALGRYIANFEPDLLPYMEDIMTETVEEAKKLEQFAHPYEPGKVRIEK